MRQALSVALITMAFALAIAGPGYAQGMTGRRAGDDGRHDARHQHDGHGHDGGHDRDRHRGSAFFPGPFIYWNPYPAHATPTNGYWYYCPSAEAYYPYVTYCLDAWVPVPAQ